ncbi:MAG: TonB-dependent receptor [Bacteroidales bacterium]
MKTILMLLLAFTLTSQARGVEDRRFSINGYVTDENGEALIGAAIYIPNLSAGVVTNIYGYYSLRMPPGEYRVNFSFVGYEPIEKMITLNEKDINLNIRLIPASEEIEEVKITARKKDANVREITMSTERLTTKTIKKIPVLMGEVDVIKSIQLLPGVQNSVEGSSGFYVRGGNVDQNLILLDGATVYNPSHLFGFFSVFNGDALKHVELYKGGIPAEYGGRLSSVLDVWMKEGNTRKLKAEGGIGSISSRFTLDGPVFNNKASFMISGRRTYADLMLPLAKDTMAQKSKVFFYDLNAKFNYKFDEKNRLFVSGYFGKDVNRFGDMFSMNYGNSTGTIRWNHVYNNNLFSNTTLIYSNFKYDLGVPQGSVGFRWVSNIIDYSIKNDYTWYITPGINLKFGFQSTYHVLKPGVSESTGDDSFISALEYPEAYGLENGVFASLEHNITDKLSYMLGLRFSTFHNVGEGTIYSYQKEPETGNYLVSDTTWHEKGDFFQNYHGLAPRMGIRYMINDKNSVKASYNRTFQYMHLASNTTASFPLDMWFMSSPNVKPQKADQLAVGYFRNFLDNTLEGSVEVYYKKMYNSIDFKDHAYLVPNQFLEGELRFGETHAYGTEFMLKKNTGSVTGWLSYTWARAFREIPEVNQGKKYSPPYDKPHNFSLMVSYELNDKWHFATNWVYTSANPVSVPVGGYYYGNVWIPQYSERNSVRIPGTDYHRMDISATWHFKTFKKFESNLNLSVYNVYNRHNAFAVYYRDKNSAHVKEENSEGKRVDVIKLYLFPVIPSVTFNIKF